MDYLSNTSKNFFARPCAGSVPNVLLGTLPAHGLVSELVS